VIVARIFVPLSSPGLAMVGTGALAVAKGTFDTIEITAIVLGLVVVAVAGVFTIRSNVAKIWREQAEGEKARNEQLVLSLAEAVKEHAEELAKIRGQHAEAIAALRAEAAEQRELKHTALTDLAAANMRTDLTELLRQLGVQHKEILARFDNLAEAVNGSH
jgi:hypothetical protein